MFSEFIRPELLVLIPALIVIGAILKEAKPVKNNFIPLILGGISIALAVVWTMAASYGLSAGEVLTGIFTGIVQGILCAGGAVYGNQIFKQVRSLKDDETK